MARVLLFGRLADIAGWRERTIEASDLDGLRRGLSRGDARLGDALRAPGVQAAVDRQVIRGDIVLAANAEVAFMPPMSGG